MPLDGIVLSSIVYELNDLLTGARVERINQTEKDEIILTCHTFSGKYNLLISANPSNPRMHLTADKKDNPLIAPPFCMVLRKHIKGGRITSVIQSGYDRVVTVNFEVFDDLEGTVNKHLTAEIMGKYSNIILTGDSGIIYDAIKHIDSSMSSMREILPAHYYAMPPAQDKISPEASLKITEELKNQTQKVKSALLSVISGFSPMLCESICEKAGIYPDSNMSDLTEYEKNSLFSVLENVLADIKNRKYVPSLFYRDGDEAPFEFHCLKDATAGNLSKECSSANMMLDTFYTQRDRAFRLSQKKAVLLKKINSALDHCRKKLEIYTETLKGKEECELLRIRGELVKAYIYMIKPGDESFSCVNYFDEQQKEITVPLDKNLSPSANAVKYFRKYRKQKSAIESAEKFYAECEEEYKYLESVKTLLENCAEDYAVSETKEELVKSGYIKEENPAKAYKTRKVTDVKAESLPYKTFSSDGYEILIGKNNRQNDLLTFKTASPDDIWLHIKDAPGSHVILRTNNGNVSGHAIEEAAEYAAGYSSVHGETKVSVDYTRVKYVKKQPGGKPGMVIFTNNKNILVVGKKLPNITK